MIDAFKISTDLVDEGLKLIDEGLLEIKRLEGKLDDAIDARDKATKELAEALKNVKHWESIAYINGKELETVHDQREEFKKKLEDAYVEIERINKERKNISKGAEKNAHLANFYHTRWWNLIYFMDDIYPESWRGIWKEWQEKTGRVVGKEKDQVTVLETKLTESTERLKMIHYILTGGGALGYRVDKAIRKIEKWQGETDE